MKKKISILIISAIVIGVSCAAMFMFPRFDGEEAVRINIPATTTVLGLRDTLTTRLGVGYGKRVYRMWQLGGGDIAKSHGSYVVEPGTPAVKVAKCILGGLETPVKVTFNNMRSFSDLTKRLASRLEVSQAEIDSAFADTLLKMPEIGSRANFMASVIPDSYEFYWSASPKTVVSKLLDRRNSFWTEERRAKAKALNLTPAQVATVASIVEEESNKADERPIIARLYLNRLAKGMKLQADPTVKFASGNFGLRRITGRQLAIDSPYNTYKYEGLPPGPIRVPEAATLDAVLNAPSNNYLYMCAKEDFSGRHNFAADYSTHQANARRYQQALDRRGIN